MRKVIEEQMKFGEVIIENIEFDIRSRDEIPKLLFGFFKEAYCNLPLREQVFEVLRKLMPSSTNSNKGRRGMDLWKILVLGTLRLKIMVWIVAETME